MSDISVSYKNITIAQLSESGNVVLATEGKYCEDNIEIEYVSPQPNYGIYGVVYGTVTPVSNSGSITVPRPTTINPIISFEGYIPSAKWSNYEGDETYDNFIAGWYEGDKKRYWASNVSDSNTLFAFLSTNANYHTYKTNGVSLGDEYWTLGGISGFKFIAGETYEYIIVGVKL